MSCLRHGRHAIRTWFLCPMTLVLSTEILMVRLNLNSFGSIYAGSRIVVDRIMTPSVSVPPATVTSLEHVPNTERYLVAVSGLIVLPNSICFFRILLSKGFVVVYNESKAYLSPAPGLFFNVSQIFTKKVRQ